jgi:Icc-related predicted phosphoesterase
LRFKRRQKREHERDAEEDYRIFFATDIHGSDRCFRKFLAAAGVYEASALILGGDFAGKAIVPIVRLDSGKWRVTFQGAERDIEDDDVATVEAQIAFTGLYPRRCDNDEWTRLRDDQDYRGGVFGELIQEQVTRWCDLACDRLPADVECIITPGNDDPLAIDSVLADARRIECPERSVTKLGPVWLASLGSTNRTPWNTEREFSEEELCRQIKEMLKDADDGRPLVFNFHCPPYDSGLDTVAKLDSDLRPITERGVPIEEPVGSTAVREAILRYKPTVGLHGHIHEARGAQRVGTSYCLNPGSDYASGVLQGAIVDVSSEGDYLGHMLTTG